MSFETEKLVPKPYERRAAERAATGLGDSPARTREEPGGESNAAPPAADIFINCPNTGNPVATGLATRSVVFNSLPPVAIPLRCSACGQIHRWKPQDAWIGQLPSPDRPARLVCAAS
jgi:hypothetical protein